MRKIAPSEATIVRKLNWNGSNTGTPGDQMTVEQDPPHSRETVIHGEGCPVLQPEASRSISGSAQRLALIAPPPAPLESSP